LTGAGGDEHQRYYPRLDRVLRSGPVAETEAALDREPVQLGD